MNQALLSALEKVREQSGGPGAEMPLTTMGAWLRQLGVDLKAAGYPKLTMLLASQPGYCEVEGGIVRFRDGEITRFVPSLTTAPTSGTLRQDLWQAMIHDVPDSAAFLDLSTLRIVRVPLTEGQPTGEVADEPIRYLRVPTLRSSEQRDLARDFLEHEVDAALVDQITADERTWMRSAREHLSEVQQARLLAHRREAVIQRARTWLEAHDVPIRVFIQRHSPAPTITSGPPPYAAPSSNSSSTFRTRLHQIIDQMTVAELHELRIPARFALLDES